MMEACAVIASVRFFPRWSEQPLQDSILDLFSIPCLNLAWIVPVKSWCTGRPLACRAGPLELTVLHTLHSLLPDILRNVPWDLFFPQRSSLEWQIASCHKVENITTAQQKLRSEGSDMQWGKWIRLYLILCDISSRGFTILSVQRFCWLTPVFFSSKVVLLSPWVGAGELSVPSSRRAHGVFPLAQN